jgi:hypothetical protein
MRREARINLVTEILAGSGESFFFLEGDGDIVC